MTWAPPKPNVWGYTLDQLKVVRCEALQQALNLLHDTKEYTRQDCISALENLIKELL